MANTTNYNWETPDDTDLVKDGAAAIRTLGSSVDTTTKALNPSTTLGDIEYRSATANTNTRLPIGTTGQILSVVGGVPSWVANDVGDITEVQAGTGISVASGTGPVPVITNTVATAIDAKGDLVVGTGADTFSRLAVGTNTYILTADSAEATGLKWAAPAGGGGMTSIASGSLSGASLDLTSISGSYKNLVLILRAATPANDTTVIGRLNNDSTGIYNYVSNRQSGGTYSTDSANTATSFPITSATGQNPQSGALVFTVFDYANTTAHKQVQLQYNFTQNTGAICNNFVAGAYRSTSAITRITLTLGSGNWSSGTYILYGVN